MKDRALSFALAALSTAVVMQIAGPHARAQGQAIPPQRQPAPGSQTSVLPRNNPPAQNNNSGGLRNTPMPGYQRNWWTTNQTAWWTNTERGWWTNFSVANSNIPPLWWTNVPTAYWTNVPISWWNNTPAQWWTNVPPQAWANVPQSWWSNTSNWTNRPPVSLRVDPTVNR